MVSLRNTAKVLVGIALFGGLTLGYNGCQNNETVRPSETSIVKTTAPTAVQPIILEGIIKSIDEDSIAVMNYDRGANVTFENFRITAGGITYRLLMPGPSNYKAGDTVLLSITPKTQMSYDEIIAICAKEPTGLSGVYSMQKGHMDLDGVINSIELKN